MYDKNFPTFVGRRTVLFDLVQVLKGDPYRLINLCGPEGIGKSRISWELLKFMNDRYFFKDGINYVDMQGVTSIESFKRKL
jgi:predicted ATPase